MTILALEFSSAQRSVAVARGGKVLAEAVETGGRNVAAFALVENVLAEAKIEREEIELLAVGLGPGSYTGIRAAIALAQGWQLARGTLTIGVSSISAIAAQAQSEKIFGRVNVIVDAQRGEFYFAEYDIAETTLKEITPLKISSAAQLPSPSGAAPIFAGPDAAKFFTQGRALFPRAATIAALAAARNDFLPGEKLEPIYLRETNFVKARVVR